MVRDVVIGMSDGLTVPFALAAEVAEVFHAYGLSHAESKPVVDALVKRPEAWVDFMMRFELGLEKPDPKRARVSAATAAFVIAKALS